MSTIWVFPGQGSQKINMLNDLPKTELVKYYLEYASSILGENIFNLDQELPLQSTYAVQICLYVAGVISAETLFEYGLKPDYVAGLSIGAWAAATAAGTIKFEDGVRLVARRATLMQEAYPKGYGMTALIGTDKGTVTDWVAAIYQQKGDVFVANINTSDQIVISGSFDAMQKVSDIARKHGVATKTLNVSVPSHCELLTPQAKILAKEVQSLPKTLPRIRYISGTTARLMINGDQIIDDITFNMSRMIDWESTAQSAWERGVRLQIEAWPGTVLTGLTQKVFKSGTTLSMQGTLKNNLIVEMMREKERQY